MKKLRTNPYRNQGNRDSFLRILILNLNFFTKKVFTFHIWRTTWEEIRERNNKKRAPFYSYHYFNFSKMISIEQLKEINT